ncbi:Relaxin receptor 2 [Nymphon striatum]|nr:Relaxin receptor 2 [Nymphon striatum]
MNKCVVAYPVCIISGAITLIRSAHQEIMQTNGGFYYSNHCESPIIDCLYIRHIDTKIPNVFSMIQKLGHNPLTTFPANAFRFIPKLESLYLESIVIDDISIQLFQPLKDLNRIYVPFVRVCEPRSNGLSSTQHLLVKPVLRISIWIVATLTCIGNTVVLLGRTFFPSNGEETSQISLLFIKNLSAADLLMGIYLFVVALKDMDFRDTYNANAHLWMSSFTCTLCGILAMTSSESTRSHAHCKKVDMELAKRFFFIVMTDCLCWIPIIVLKIIALTETDIPQDLYAWVVVFILPVNSAMNPIIYSISSKAFWNKIRDLVKQKISWPTLCSSRTRSYICMY